MSMDCAAEVEALTPRRCTLPVPKQDELVIGGGGGDGGGGGGGGGGGWWW
jgi:hypothetical protein